jgi:hypothetical protein
LNQSKLQELVEVEIRKNEKELIEYKKGEYLVGDIYGDDSRVPYKDDEYAIYKYFKNPLAGGETDLINTGAFINSFFLQKPIQNKYIFGAKDSKANKLKKKYSNDIFGLNELKFDRFLNIYVIEDFKKILKKQLGQ